MGFEITLLGNSLIQKQAVNDVVKCNDLTGDYGLTLTENQAIQLVKTRSFALKETGRVEFGGGVIDKIIYAFCNSPYISMSNYTEVLHELIEIFYYFKNEAIDLIGDDDLINYMKKSYDGVCQGSLDLLSDRELPELARNLRFGYPIENPNEEIEEVLESEDDL